MYKTRQAETPSKQKKSSPLRLVLEGIFFLGWLFCTGIAGYFVGHTQKHSAALADCPPVTIPATSAASAVKKPCPKKKKNAPSITADAEEEDAPSLEGGYTMEELDTMWTCSHAKATNITQVNQQLLPAKNSLDKTKWKSILTVEPKAFFDRYLSQYPGDTRATQPVVVFSHKPLEKFEDMEEVCKVIDVAIVPDEPGVCVAVTETFHDVASYHMLHADKQADGTFALTSNSVEGRTLPEEAHYAAARALLLDFFTYTDVVSKAVKSVPKYDKNKVGVATLIENEEDLELFRNSVAGAGKLGVSLDKYVVFTSSKEVSAKARTELKNIRTVAIPQLSKVGGGKIEPNMRRMFLQAWLAFAVSASGNKMLWQSPGTIWLAQPDDIVANSPVVETIWAFKGRNDVRAAPFFNSLDFFVVTGAERAVHLIHEILLHFDLVLAWGSLDALAAYRLAENNARYGTTSYLLPPAQVLHTELMGHDSAKLKAAATGAKKPRAIVVPSDGMTSAQAKKMLQGAGLWYL